MEHVYSEDKYGNNQDSEEDSRRRKGWVEVMASASELSTTNSELGVSGARPGPHGGRAAEGEEAPPALPPRPPPRPRPSACTVACTAPCSGVCPDIAQEVTSVRSRVRRPWWRSGLRKYVILCTTCGGLAALLGALFFLVYFILRSYTSSLNYFETVPTYVPAIMLMVTGLVVMCFARRRNRCGYLIKLSGGCCLLCAVLCVVVTVTTTVIHMNRLQTLKECTYNEHTQSCSCSPVIAGSQMDKADPADGFIFANTPDCEVIHGALYSCLRAMFGLSVIGILVCIFSCMLVYQLLSHEKKKMYWEQLEMRCRYLNRRNPHYAYCSCCDECRYPAPPELSPWQPWEVLDDRYWAQRTGNLYTPNPEETTASNQPQTSQRGHRLPGWNWLPWNRNSDGSRGRGETPSSPTGQEATGDNGQRETTTTEETALPTYRSNQAHSPGHSPDSQYGFGVGRGFAALPAVRAPFVLDHHCRRGVPQPGRHHQPPFVTDASFLPPQIPYGGVPRYLWGPPPPYSQPPSSDSTTNSQSGSPAREPILNIPTSPSRHHHHHHHHHLHHHHCEMGQASRGSVGNVAADSRSQGTSMSPDNPVGRSAKQIVGVHSDSHEVIGVDARRYFSSDVINSDDIKSEDVEDYKNIQYMNPDMPDKCVSNTLPVRKTKKRLDISSVKSLSNIPSLSEEQQMQQFQAQHQQQEFTQEQQQESVLQKRASKFTGGPFTNLHMLFGQRGPQVAQHHHHQQQQSGDHESEMKTAKDGENLESPVARGYRQTPSKNEPESEVYFADVSSCNVSVRNDGPDSSLYDEAMEPQRSPAREGFIPHTSPLHNRLHEYHQRLHQKIPRGSHCQASRPQPPPPPPPQPSADQGDLEDEKSPEYCISKGPSEQSLAITETENTYSFTSPMTDISSASPSYMVTDGEMSSSGYYGNSSCQGAATASSSPVNEQFPPLASPEEQDFVNPVSMNVNLRHHSHHHGRGGHQQTEIAPFTMVPAEYLQYGADHLAPDAQYESANSNMSYHRLLQPSAFQNFIPSPSDVNGNLSGRGEQTKTPQAETPSDGNFSIPPTTASPSRRVPLFNLPLRQVVTSPGNNNNPNNNKNSRVIELYQESTEEDASGSEPQQGMTTGRDSDSGCHSGTELIKRRNVVSGTSKSRNEDRTDISKRSYPSSDPSSPAEEELCPADVVVTMRSVNV